MAKKKTPKPPKESKEYTVSVEIRSSYDVPVVATSYEDAHSLAEGMQTTEIRDKGKLVNVETVVNEVIGVEE
jgi:hypothetical protein